MARNFYCEGPVDRNVMNDLHQEVKLLQTENSTLRLLLRRAVERAEKAEAALKEARNAQKATLNIPEVEETVGAGAVPPRGRSRSPRQKFTVQHDAAIVRWLLANDKADEVGGIVVWRQISDAKIAGENRSVDSLQTHWRRMIRPKLETFGLSEAELAKFR